VHNFRAAGRSDRGPVRRTNEDAFLHDEELGLLLVADGMGGHAAGEVASQLATDAIVGFVRRSHSDHEYSWPYGIEPTLSLNSNRLRTAIHIANRRVFRAAENHDDYTGMGTTVVAVLWNDQQISIAHVGDSRLYVLSGGALIQLTQDDSWAATVLGLPSSGDLPLAQHPLRNVLTNVLGARDQTDVHLQERSSAPRETLLLCTDGLHGVLDSAAITEILKANPKPEDAAAALVQSALDRGSRDNVTAIVATCEAV
jgi:serine/threonine protein phosphatase PrpC